MIDWIARILFVICSVITGDEIYLILALLWEIWSELTSIRKSLNK